MKALWCKLSHNFKTEGKISAQPDTIGNEVSYCEHYSRRRSIVFAIVFFIQDVLKELYA